MAPNTPVLGAAVLPNSDVPVGFAPKVELVLPNKLGDVAVAVKPPVIFPPKVEPPVILPPKVDPPPPNKLVFEVLDPKAEVNPLPPCKCFFI